MSAKRVKSRHANVPTENMKKSESGYHPRKDIPFTSQEDAGKYTLVPHDFFMEMYLDHLDKEIERLKKEENHVKRKRKP